MPHRKRKSETLRVLYEPDIDLGYWTRLESISDAKVGAAILGCILTLLAVAFFGAL